MPMLERLIAIIPFLDHTRSLCFSIPFREERPETWAKGLKKAGYAANPKYPDKLIVLSNVLI